MVEVAADEQEVGNADEVEQEEIDDTVELGPSVTQDAFNLLVEVGLVGSTVHHQDATRQVLHNADHDHDQKRAYQPILDKEDGVDNNR